MEHYEKSKNINSIMSLLSTKKVSKEAFLGVAVSIILNKNLLNSNLEVAGFIKYVFKQELPIYAIKSRTVMTAKACRIIFNSTETEIRIYSDTTFDVMRAMIAELNDVIINTEIAKNNNKNKSKNKENSLSNMNKWILGILKKDN
ncbi:hypothetical protein [Pantoea ananatis]